MTSETRKQHEQLNLLPTALPQMAEMTPELVALVCRKPTFLAAWNLAVDFSGLEDKQVYQPLGIDSAHWSKIRSGRASPPADERFLRFLDVVRNEFPLVWLAESRGYDWLTIRRHRSSEEERIAELEKENRELKRSMALWASAMRDAK